MTSKQPRSFWLTANGLAAIVLIAFVSYFLLIEHRQHLFQWLPLLIILACPLLHVFMHRGHGHDGNDSDRQDHAHHDHKNRGESS